MAGEFFDAVNNQLLIHANEGGALTRMADRNLTQGFGVVLESVVQAQASVSDDSGLIAALQTASRAPVQGSNDKIA